MTNSLLIDRRMQHPLRHETTQCVGLSINARLFVHYGEVGVRLLQIVQIKVGSCVYMEHIYAVGKLNMIRCDLICICCFA